MSKRLVLLSGTPRAGTSTLAKAAVREAADHGYRTTLISWESLDVTALRERSWHQIVEVLAMLMPNLDLTDHGDFMAFPGIDDLLALRAIAREIESDADVVVVDAGQVDRLIAAVAWLETVDDLLYGLHTPQLVEDLTNAHALVTTIRAELAEIKGALFDAQSTVRIVTTPDDVIDAAHAIAGLSLVGLHVDGVIINKVPRKGDDWPTWWVKQQRARADEGAALLDALPTGMVRLRKGRVKVSLARHFGLDTAWTKPPISAVEAVADGYHWTVPLIDPVQQDVRVGYRGDAVFIQVGPYRRRLAMPSVVQRCVITEAEVRPDTVTLICRPNAQVWPA